MNLAPKEIKSCISFAPSVKNIQKMLISWIYGLGGSVQPFLYRKQHYSHATIHCILLNISLSKIQLYTADFASGMPSSVQWA